MYSRVQSQNFSRSRTLKELFGFLGLINFYTKFSKNHAVKIIPFLELLKKGFKWSWNDDFERYFNEMKLLTSSSVLLNYSGIKKLFYLQTDASDVALGAELAYYTTEKKLLAIVCGLQKFRSYIM